MSKVALLLYLMDEAFAGGGLEQSNESQSLLSNLATVNAPMWRARPIGGTRTIEAITRHVAACKVRRPTDGCGSAIR